MGTRPRGWMVVLAIAVCLTGTVRAMAHDTAPRAEVATLGTPVSATTLSSTTAPPNTSTTVAPSTTVPAVAPSVLAGQTACPCEPATGEPLGGAAIGKGVDGVVSDVHGQPVSGICVTVDEFDAPISVTVVSGQDGSYRLDLGTGNEHPLFELVAHSCDGSWDPWLETQLGPPDLDMNSYNHDVHIVMHRAGTLAGTAVDVNGQPFAGGCVRAGAGDHYVEVPIGPHGHFEVRGLVPGTVAAAVHLPCDYPALSTPGFTEELFTVAADTTTTVQLVAYRCDWVDHHDGSWACNVVPPIPQH